MGQVIDGISFISIQNQTKKLKELNLSQYTVATQQHSGNVIYRMQENQYSICVTRQLSQSNFTAIKKQLLQWIDTNFKYSCNVKNFHLRTQAIFCNSQVVMQMLFEYGNKSLLQMLTQKQTRQRLEFNEEKNKQNFNFSSTPLQIITILKFMIDAVDEHREKGFPWLEFHTKNIIYFTSQRKFKYFGLHHFDQKNEFQTFFAPEKTQVSSNSQLFTVFSMGVVLLSVFLGQDCSDCYNYHNFTFCHSIFQNKLEEMSEHTMKKEADRFFQQDILSNETAFQDQIAELIYEMTAQSERRIQYSQIKKRYLTLLRRISFGFDSNMPNFSQRRVVDKSVQIRKIQKTSNDDQTFRLKFERSHTLINQKSNFTEPNISTHCLGQKSNLNKIDHGQMRMNSAVKLKNKLTNRKKVDKQNLNQKYKE